MDYTKYRLQPINIHSNCDEGFAAGMRAFQDELFVNYPRISHTFQGRKYSLKTLLAKHLDHPLEKLLTSYYEGGHREVFEDFKLSEISTKFDHRTDLTPNQKISDSLQYWDYEIHKYVRRLDLDYEDPQEFWNSENLNDRLAPTHDDSSELIVLDENPTLQSRFYSVIDTLIPFISQLKMIRSGVSMMVLSSDKSENFRTTRHYPEEADRTCNLCWRNTERYEIRRNVNSNTIINSSAKFCYKHAINGRGASSENWANYIKGRKYKARYLKEIDNLSRYSPDKDEARYLIKISHIKRVFEKKQGFYFNDDGERALAYYLVRSGLDNNGYRRIYNAKCNDELSNAQIARKFKITRQAVGQIVKKIELKLYNVHKKTIAAEDSLIMHTRI